MTEDEENTEHVEVYVPDMDCESCAGKVRSSLEDLGISEQTTNPTTGVVKVSYNPDHTTYEDIVEKVETAGYSVSERRSTQSSVLRSRRSITTAISGVFVALGLILEFIFTQQDAAVIDLLGNGLSISSIFYLSAVVSSGSIILRNGYRSLKSLNLDIDILMSTAVIGSITTGIVFGESLYFEAGMLVFLFNVAELLETYSMNKARSSLNELMNLSPDTASVERDDEFITVDVREVSVGETVEIKPGEKIPLDGVVIDGESAVDQSSVTGESVPVDKMVDDEVFAGSINKEGYIKIRVTSLSENSTIQQVIQMVENAQESQTEQEKIVDRFSSYYTPSVVIMGVLLAIIPPLVFGLSWSTYIVYGLTLFVLACPCALIISTPVSVVSGITSAAKNGVLVRSGEDLETMGSIDTVAFDKTGTITKGELTVSDIIPLNGRTEKDVLECAYGIESKSEHPIGDAVVERAEEMDIEKEEVVEFQSITGKGIEADVHGKKHYVGKLGLFEENGFDLRHAHATTDQGTITGKTKQLCEQNNCLNLLEDIVPDLQSQGKTVVLIGTEDKLEGIIAIEDQIREDAERVVSQLRDLGITNLVMLTGDNKQIAQSVSEQVGIDDYHAELLPNDKVNIIQKLQNDGGSVAMVGDGINDAPSMTVSDVGIAMGAAGTDTAIETADIALMDDKLEKLPYLYSLSTKTKSVIRQNILFSILVKALLIVAVPFSLVPVWLAVLVGDAGMTTGVTGNAMRLSNVDGSRNSQRE